MCNRCHDGARITAMRRTKTEWEEVLDQDDRAWARPAAKRTSRPSSATCGGTTARSTSTRRRADEITTSLGLSTKDADAIVAYRKANGPFQDFEAVKKVPDIDVKTLEEHKDAVAF